VSKSIGKALMRPIVEQKVALPTYPFQRMRYWMDFEVSKKRILASSNLVHPLLGQEISTPQGKGYFFQNVFSP